MNADRTIGLCLAILVSGCSSNSKTGLHGSGGTTALGRQPSCLGSLLPWPVSDGRDLPVLGVSGSVHWLRRWAMRSLVPLSRCELRWAGILNERIMAALFTGAILACLMSLSGCGQGLSARNNFGLDASTTGQGGSADAGSIAPPLDSSRVDGSAVMGVNGGSAGNSSGLAGASGTAGAGTMAGATASGGSTAPGGGAQGGAAVDSTRADAGPADSGVRGGTPTAEAGGIDAGGTSVKLRLSVAPGGNFDLSLWELQEPVGAAGSPTTIGPVALEGPNGFQDSYFYTDPTDGAMTFWDPENGVTTANSSYPRSELREMNADGSEANWPLSGTNTLSATVAVTQVPDHVCIGQIHLGTAIQAGLASSTKPLLELFYYQNGDIKLGIEDSPTGGQTSHDFVNVPLGTTFSYTIQLTGDGTITLDVDGATSTFTMPSSFVGYGQYFKAGGYDQTVGSDATIGATVKFFALQVSHQPT